MVTRPPASQGARAAMGYLPSPTPTPREVRTFTVLVCRRANAARPASLPRSMELTQPQLRIWVPSGIPEPQHRCIVQTRWAPRISGRKAVCGSASPDCFMEPVPATSLPVYSRVSPGTSLRMQPWDSGPRPTQHTQLTHSLSKHWRDPPGGGCQEPLGPWERQEQHRGAS